MKSSSKLILAFNIGYIICCNSSSRKVEVLGCHGEEAEK